MMEEGMYSEAFEVFTGLGEYGDSTTMITYVRARSLQAEKDYENAIAVFEELNGYKDSAAKIEECKTAILDPKFNRALELMEQGYFDGASFDF